MVAAFYFMWKLQTINGNFKINPCDTNPEKNALY